METLEDNTRINVSDSGLIPSTTWFSEIPGLVLDCPPSATNYCPGGPLHHKT